ncbi:MAG: aldo/keto reductase [Candidatus Dadabacteria bacterium]|nr:aldo/keto reductase [Candidatus Dadabacteria bacterium]NIS09806.1 aldo/keto reductase [Candidatus Dadabacteria bacterium]NIV41162.1 aldo/keto reductase [Candidatus Dadabacteria bacterium]NIX16247.1 aldo/keto reductase [Candidatus Dadabacteria bacterium]NIY22867.1 aldo/keto reductase [Candidatus Dadabacteria bacterium]
MKFRRLGNTGLKVSEIGFGAWAIGGAGYGDTDDNESKKALSRALDLGVNFIDTADSYGNGHSEKLIGAVLEARRDKQTIICTKFGWDFYSESGIKSNLDKEYVRFALQNSLQRLKRHVIDVYLIHDSNPEKIEQSGVIETLRELKREGFIKFFGISVNDFYLKQVVSHLDTLCPDVVEIRFNLLENESKTDLLELCRVKGIGVIVREPLANGLLSGKYNKDSVFAKNDHRNGFKREYLEKQINNVDLFRKYFNSNSDMVRGSIKFTLQFPEVSVAIPGVKTVSQIEENISSLDYDFNLRQFEKFKKAI